MGKEVFPPQTTEGGVRLPYILTKEEMENCAYASRAGAVCSRKQGKRSMIVGAPMPLISCLTCQYHPGDMPFEKQVMEIKSMPNYEKMREIQNETRGLPKDAHRRLLK